MPPPLRPEGVLVKPSKEAARVLRCALAALEAHDEYLAARKRELDGPEFRKTVDRAWTVMDKTGRIHIRAVRAYRKALKGGSK